ncbi:MFS transporter [Polymorphobacter fuscus]|uniref:MFS transporter n=1 Tax=Sandarakinorhabdus fusca TaxID=1439888 RepID=A0A7C9GW56_9SPHN|nr:MFS transporter [Polymorphobacter fuscus]KAB7645539.1 MFS transporter [Polymorphobacter fuscus]MQT17978.1 MFS transporter [Polymorphobacter fuscus]
MTIIPRDAAPYPSPARAWTTVLVLFLTAVLAYTDRQVLSLLVDPIKAELGIDDTGMSLLLGTAFAVIYGIAGIPLGILADRRSRRNLILAGVAIWSLGTLGCAVAPSFGWLFAARIVVGLGEAVLSPAAISLISDSFAPNRRGTAVGVYFTGIAIGVGGSIMIGGAVLDIVGRGLFAGTSLADWSPWRQVLLAIGAPSLLWALALLVVREPVRRDDVVADGPDAVAAPTGLWTGIAPVFLIVAVASMVDNAVGAWAPSLLIRQFGVDPATVGVQLGLLLVLGYGGGMLAGGMLADRFAQWRGARGKIELCGLAAIATLPAAMLINSASLSAVMTAIPVYFALSAVVTASGLSAILDATPNRRRGRAMAISFFLNVAIGAGIGPTLVALAGQHVFGAGAGLGPAISLTVIASYLLATLALLPAIRARRP